MMPVGKRSARDGTDRRGLADWPLRRRFTAAVLVAAALVTVLSAVVVATFLQVGDAQARVTQTFYAAVRHSASLIAAHLDQETGVRGYLLTSDVRFLAPYQSGAAEEERLARELSRLPDHDPAPLVQLAALRQESREWREHYAEPVIAQVRAGGARQVTTEQQDTGKQLFDRVRRMDEAFQRSLEPTRTTAVADPARAASCSP
jgi:CHASE3 domain sensor protein